MKKFIALLLVAVMTLTMFTACGSTDEGSEPTTDATVFKMGFDAEYPPYSYMADDGTYTGFDIEMAQAVCKELGWEIELIPIDWDAKDAELNSGAIDCIWSGFTINGREDDYAWSIPYVDNSQVILTKGDSGIAAPADLAGKKVGVQIGTSALELLSEGGDCADLAATFGELLTFNSYNTAFVELEAGSVDAVAIDIGVAKYQVASRGEGEYVILDEAIATEEYGVGFRVADTDLRDQVQEAILKLVADGTYAELAEKYELTDFICLQAGTTENAVDAIEEEPAAE